jgi:hypothetical protein
MREQTRNKIIFTISLTISLVLLLLLISSVSASPYIVPQPIAQGLNYSLKLPCTNNGTDCLGTSSCNITLTNPNGTNIFLNQPLSNSSFPLWNITINDTYLGTQGWYNGYYVCVVGSGVGKEQVQFQVTGFGKPEPSGGVIVFFSIMLFIIYGTMIYVFFHSIGHMLQLDFDLRDLGFNWGILFCYYVFVYLTKIYLGNPDFIKFMNPVLIVAVIFNGFLPILAFVLNLTVGTMIRKNNEVVK